MESCNLHDSAAHISSSAFRKTQQLYTTRLVESWKHLRYSVSPHPSLQFIFLFSGIFVSLIKKQNKAKPTSQPKKKNPEPNKKNPNASPPPEKRSITPSLLLFSTRQGTNILQRGFVVIHPKAFTLLTACRWWESWNWLVTSQGRKILPKSSRTRRKLELDSSGAF